MLTAGSVENFIALQMEKYGMAALFLGKLCQLYGIPASQTRLSAALRGQSLPNEVGQRVRELVIEVTNYVDEAQTPVALVDAAQIKTILDERRAWKQAVKFDEDKIRKVLLEPENGTIDTE